MNFLEKVDFTNDEINDVKMNNSELLVKEAEKEKDIVLGNIEFLKNLGVQNYKEIVVSYLDMFLMENKNFKDVFEKYDTLDLIDKLKKNVKIIEFL